MINLHVLVFLSLAVALTVGQEYPETESVDCSSCDYYNGNIGYVKSEKYCAVFYVCYRNPHKPNAYKYNLLCCPEGQSFDPEHLTCSWQKSEDCDEGRYYCPEIVTPKYPVGCLYKPVPEEIAQFASIETHQIFECGFGTVWDQDICSCVIGEEYHDRDPNCNKILNYNFDKSFESFGCNGNRASGIPVHGELELVDGTLCLDGSGEYLAIPYLNNFFAWNPIAHAFTLCFCFQPYSQEYDVGVFSTGCDPNPFISIILQNNGIEVIIAGNSVVIAGFPPTDSLSSICVVFDYGHFYVYYNGGAVEHGYDPVAAYPGNDQVASSLGFVKGFDGFHGYFDDFCFWTSADPDIAAGFKCSSYEPDY